MSRLVDGDFWTVDVKNSLHNGFFKYVKEQGGITTASVHAPGSDPADMDALTFISVTMPKGWEPDAISKGYGPWTRARGPDITGRPDPVSPGGGVGSVLVATAVVGGLGYLLLRLARSRPAAPASFDYW